MATNNKRIREKHGIADAKRMAAVGATTDEAVTVTDAPPFVLLDIQNATYSAGLTPEQARMIARHLQAAATRVDKSLGNSQR